MQLNVRWFPFEDLEMLEELEMSGSDGGGGASHREVGEGVNSGGGPGTKPRKSRWATPFKYIVCC